LAAKIHLDRWIELATKNKEKITKIGVQIGINSNIDTNTGVVKWAYKVRHEEHKCLWLSPGKYTNI
jgi:hypothetical protein